MTSAAAVAGAMARPADLPCRARLVAGRAPRLSAAIVVTVALHVALLTFRPGLSGARQPASPAPPVMAVRLLRTVAPPVALPVAPAAVAEPTAAPPQAIAEATPAPTPAARSAHDSTDVAPRGDARAERPPAAATLPSSAEPAPPSPSLAAAPDYAFGATLNPGPRPLDDIEPDYSDPYLREGVVVLRLLIGVTGHVDDVAVVRSTPHGVFEQGALEAFAKARFAPGLAGGMPVKSQITVEVNFVPLNRGARISGRTY